MPHLGEKLKLVRLAKDMNQTQMAEFLGVSFRSYQDIEKTGKIKKSEIKDSILKRTGIDTQIAANSGHADAPGYVPASDLIQVLKEHNEFLRRNFEFSLTGISVQAASILAYVSTSLEKDDEREAAGDKKKLQQIRTDTGKRIGEKMGAGVKSDRKTADR